MADEIIRSKHLALLITPNLEKSTWVQFAADLARTKEASVSKQVIM